MMERPAVKQNVTHITIDGYLAGRSSGEGREAMCTVPERLSYKVHSEMPYSDLMSLLDDRRPDGSLNEHFYGGVQFTLWKRLLPFLSWDGERMLKIAIDELVYGNEDSAAFLPLLPWLANIGGKALRFLHLSHAARLGIDASSVEAPKALYMGIAGLVITNIAGIIAAGVLYLLVWEVLYRRKLMADSRDGIPVLTIDELKPMSITYEYIERIAYFSVVFFCLGPATVHCTSIYTENLFCLSTFSGQLLLFAAEDHRKIATHGSGHKTKSYIKSYVYEVAAVALFFLGSALRSNGVLLLVPLFFYTVRTCGIIGRFNVLYGYDMNRLGLRRSAYDGKVTFLSILRFFSHWVRALIYAILLIVPMAVFQGYLYCMYCLKLPSEQFHAIRRYPGFVRLLVKSDGITLLQKVLSAEKRYVRPWCSSIPPRAYDYVQKKYWDVGFLWVLRPPSRLHVFLYCWTTYMVTYYAIRWYGVTVHQLRAKIWRSFAGMFELLLFYIITHFDHD
ncbi:GPI mannosyltransferase 2, putative [Babesia caballi]|uniref:GPI mannosyltransferase 2 n=1 Tax=Babesia caballi TaxID=5871 RepID=A0AAV4M0W1_BABCB|nr:GPI mannosyltransferase 2, putative [Babesia caballi]